MTSSNEGFGTSVPPVGGASYPPPAPTYPASTFGGTAQTYINPSAQPSAPKHAEAPSTADVAKDKAADVAGGAADAAKNVAGVAKEQAGQVAAEAKKQVKDLVGQARTELSDQAGVQQQRVAVGLRSVGDQLRSMAEGSSEQGPAVDIAHQAAAKVHEIAEFFENRDPGSVLEEVRSFARRQPGAFLAISLGAGILAGRLARGLTADPDDTSSGSATTSGSAYPAASAGYLGTEPPRAALGTVPAVPPFSTGQTSTGQWPSDAGFSR